MVDTARGQIGCHYHIPAAVLEFIQRLLARTLAQPP